jgi:hypothetical protein
MEEGRPTRDQLEAWRRSSDSRVLRGSVLVRSPAHPEVTTIAPGQWRPIDELVSELGMRFTLWGHDFDIQSDVEGELGKGLVGLLILDDPETPRPPSPEEAAVLGLPRRLSE